MHLGKVNCSEDRSNGSDDDDAEDAELPLPLLPVNDNDEDANVVKVEGEDVLDVVLRERRLWWPFIVA